MCFPRSSSPLSVQPHLLATLLPSEKPTAAPPNMRGVIELHHHHHRPYHYRTLDRAPDTPPIGDKRSINFLLNGSSTPAEPAVQPASIPPSDDLHSVSTRAESEVVSSPFDGLLVAAEMLARDKSEPTGPAKAVERTDSAELAKHAHSVEPVEPTEAADCEQTAPAEPLSSSLRLAPLAAATTASAVKPEIVSSATTPVMLSGAPSDRRPGGVQKRRKKRASVQCDVCGRMFGEAAAVRKHKRVVHEKVKDFQCHICDRRFAEKSNLKKHIQARHEQARAHKCNQCDKVFNFTDGLRRHINNCHLGLRPYHCDLCSSSFKQRTHLQKHRQSVHHVSRTPPSENTRPAPSAPPAPVS